MTFWDAGLRAVASMAQGKSKKKVQRDKAHAALAKTRATATSKRACNVFFDASEIPGECLRVLKACSSV